MIQDKKIIIRKPFREQYTLTIDSEVNAIESLISSTVELRYDFQVLQVNKEFIEVRLLLLESKVVKANNPIVKEVAQVSQVFGRMYNELHLKISPDGTVLEVINNDFILSKWQETKAEMQKYIMLNPELEQTISLNDAIFNNPEQVKKAVQANEFFSIYFGHIYNINLPNTKTVVGTNIFGTANLEWSVESESTSKLPAQNTKEINILTTAKPLLPLSSGFCNAAYHHFKEKVDIDFTNINLQQVEKHSIEYETGRLQKAEVSKIEEVVENKLYHKFKFTMVSDSEKKSSQKIKTDDNSNTIAKKYTDSNGNEYTEEEWKAYKQKSWGTGKIE